jgi:hypothetical protein
MQTDPNTNPETRAAEQSNDEEMFSPHDWALHHEIQNPEARPPSPPKRELPPEDEDGNT